MLNIEKYRDRLENYDNSLDCDICKIREKCEDIKNRNCKSCYKCRKENIEWLVIAKENNKMLTRLSSFAGIFFCI